jgi:hypothetical protein
VAAEDGMVKHDSGVAAEDEWWNAIQGCKEDGKNKKLNEDKKGVARQKQGKFLSGEKELVA